MFYVLTIGQVQGQRFALLDLSQNSHHFHIIETIEVITAPKSIFLTLLSCIEVTTISKSILLSLLKSSQILSPSS